MKQSLFTTMAVICINTAISQGVTIGSNNPPDPSAGLQLDFNDRGPLISRLNTAQRNSILAPHFGLQIYNTDSDCLEMYFANGGWKPIQCGCQSYPNAVYTPPFAAYANVPATFTAPAGSLAYTWSFQSGTPAMGSSQVAQTTWSSVGKYGVTVTVMDFANCSTTYTDSIVVGICTPFMHTFTNCGATGRNGPSLSQCNSSYGAGVVSAVNGGIQEWTVPETGKYQIEAAGASAHIRQGGSGAIIRGEFMLNAGQVIKILVGQNPNSFNTDNGSGAGGTFVIQSPYNTNASILVIAGGGGGGHNNGNQPNANGSTSNSGNPGTSGAAGGTNGNGGGGSNGTGGGGFLGNGGSSTDNGGTVPSAFVNGGVGGLRNDGTIQGGFGGGGYHGNSHGAGGGGYSGGGGTGSSPYHGGGGGSYIHANATNVATSNGLYNGSSNHNGAVQNISSYNQGNGYVSVTYLCQ